MSCSKFALVGNSVAVEGKDVLVGSNLKAKEGLNLVRHGNDQ